MKNHSVISHQGTRDQNFNEKLLHKVSDNKSLQGFEETETLIHCC